MKKTLSLVLVFAGAFAILGQGLTIRSAFYLPSIKSGSSTPFSPSDLSGLEFWAKADSESYSDNDAVGTITDRSGNGRNFTQATSGNKPVFKTGIVNGKAVYRFNSTNLTYCTASEFMTAATAGEIFIVVKIDNDPPALIGSSGAPFSVLTADFTTHFPLNSDSIIYEAFGTTTRKNTGDPSTDLASAFRLYNVWSAANDYAVNIDTASHYTSGSNTVSFDPSGNTFYIGTSDGVNYFMNGDIAEITLFSRKLNGTERGQMESYFDSKYALAY